MTTTNVTGVLNLSGNLAAKPASKADTLVASDFQFVMNQTTDNTGHTKADVKAQTKSSDISRRQESKKLSSKDGNADAADTTKAADSTKKAFEKTESNTVSDNPQKAVEQAVSKIEDAIKEALSISGEELAETMAMLGISPVDLLDNDNILKIVMEQTGIDNKAALFADGNLVDTLKNLMETVQDIKEPLADVDLQLVQKMMQNTEKDMLVLQPDAPDKEISSNVEESKAVSADSTKPNVVIKAENAVDNSEKQDMRQSFSQSQQEHTEGDGLKQKNVINGETVYHNVTQAVANSQQVSYTSQAQAADIVNQIVEEIKTVVKANTTQMEVQLNPESLGKVNITVSAREGLITAQITAQTEAAKYAIESQIAVLKETFQNQGLKVEAVEVNVSPQGFDSKEQEQFQDAEQQQSKKTKRQINLQDLEISQDELSEEEIIAVDLMQHNGNNVDFMA